VKGMIIISGVDLEQRESFGASATTKLSNTVFGTERFYINQQNFLEHLRSFGEVGTFIEKPGPIIK
jgi:hypothetical protein